MISHEKIEAARIKLGDIARDIMVQEIPIERFDGKTGLSVFHKENTPSMTWFPERQIFKDFGTGQSMDYVDFAMRYHNLSFPEAVKEMFDLAGMDYEDSDFNVAINNDYFGKGYKFPEDEPDNDRAIVNAYMAKRHISEATLDFYGVKQDENGNIAFQFKNVDGKVVATKYRVSKPYMKGKTEGPKWWWNRKANMCPILYGIDKVNTTQPLLIVEGLGDCLACHEAGIQNVVSIPGGAEEMQWIKFNYDFLMSFKIIILWFDDDEIGQDGLSKVTNALGVSRVKTVQINQNVKEDISKNSNGKVTKVDANNVLVFCGAETVVKMVNGASYVPNPRLKPLFSYKEIELYDLPKISTGFKAVDKVIYGNFRNSLVVLSGFSGCVDADTEFFTGVGWKRIADYQEGDKVLQYNKDGSANLVSPNQYHKYQCENLWHFKTKYGLDQCLSDEHNVYYITSKGKLHHKTFGEIRECHERTKCGFSGKFITTFKYSGNGINLSDNEIKLMLAVICEGHFGVHSLETGWCRINLKKERKKIALRKILNDCGIEWEEKNINPNQPEYSTFRFYAPKVEKSFSEYWYNCNQHQLELICDNILQWDGSLSKGRKTFSTTQLDTANFIQFAFSACGYRVSIHKNDRVGKEYFTGGKLYKRKSIEYDLYISNVIKISMINSNEKAKINPYKTVDGYKYCFSVDSGMLVLRRNNKIFITGNSGKTTAIAKMGIISPLENGEKVMVFSGEANGGTLLGSIYRPLAGRRHVYVEDNSQRGIPNFYRVTKEARACIRDYYASLIWNYEDGDDIESSGKEILSQMDYAYNRYGVTFFTLDNLMCITCVDDSDDNKYNSQIKFIMALKRFTREHDVIVLLVAHPKKPIPGQQGVDMYGIAGASEIVNLADRAYSVGRLDPTKHEGHNSFLSILKDRQSGKAGTMIKMYYDYPTTRIYSDRAELEMAYSWERNFNFNYPPSIKDRLVINIPDGLDEILGEKKE